MTDVQKAIQVLKMLKDEIALKLHLASMDAKDTWKTLSADIERATQEMGEASSEAIADLVARARDLSKSIDRGTTPRHP
jgi:hypothetical protein